MIAFCIFGFVSLLLVHLWMYLKNKIIYNSWVFSFALMFSISAVVALNDFKWTGEGIVDGLSLFTVMVLLSQLLHDYFDNNVISKYTEIKQDKKYLINIINLVNYCLNLNDIEMIEDKILVCCKQLLFAGLYEVEFKFDGVRYVRKDGNVYLYLSDFLYQKYQHGEFEKPRNVFIELDI